MTTYNKPWLSFSDQLLQLKQRGMVVEDDEKAETYLDRIGYYRLSGYWYSFRQNCPTNPGEKLSAFVEGTHFTDALNLYIFDKKLRLLALDALERIEVAIRVDIAHLLGQRDPAGHHNAALLDGRFTQPQGTQAHSQHDKWLNHYNKLVNRSNETFIRHVRNKYGLPLPIWVAIEIWDFGAMSKLYAGMKGRDRDAIAQKYNVPDGRIFVSWLRALNYLRNLSAHHSRLWNRNMVDQPRLPTAADAGDLVSFIGQSRLIARPFVHFCILQWLMRVICPNSLWHSRFRQHLESFPLDSNGYHSIDEMGCPLGWQNWSLWQ